MFDDAGSFMLPFYCFVFDCNIFVTYAVQSIIFGLVYGLGVMYGANLQEPETYRDRAKGAQDEIRRRAVINLQECASKSS